MHHLLLIKFIQHNSDGTNVKIGDDAWIGDIDTANHISIQGVQDDTNGGVVFGSNETESISSDGTNLTLTANNDVILTPGSTYAYLNQVDPDHRIATMADITGGTGADIADFVFTNNEPDNNSSSITLPGDKQMEISAGADSDLYLNAGDDLYITANNDDIHVRANDDIRFIANYNNESIQYDWRMDSEGKFQLPGQGYIENPADSSGDGYQYDTIKIVPDAEIEGNGQYLIIDPTAPNHIHIRAGGAQDYSNAELILGGERAGVHVSDASGGVVIQSKQEDYSWSYQNINTESSATYIVNTEVAEPDYGDYAVIDGVKYIINTVNRIALSNTTEYTAIANDGTNLIFNPGSSYTFNRDQGQYYWSFDNQAYLNGPDMGGLLIRGIRKEDGNDLPITSTSAIVLTGSDGEFLNDASVPDNQIATIGDVAASRFGASASFYSTQDQGPYSAGSIQAFTFNNTDWATGVTLGGTSQITMTNAGKYNIAFSAQVHQTNSSGITNIWINKNGTPMSNTNTKVAVTANNPYYVAAWNIFVDAAAGDYYELMWSSDSQHTVMEYEAPTGSGPTLHPAVPSIILTVNQVG